MIRTIGVDIGGTNFRIGMVEDNKSVKNFIQKSSSILKEENAEYYLYKEIKSYVDSNNLNNKIDAITIGVPSCVSKDKTRIITTPNLSGLENVDLSKYLFDKLNIPIFLERDVNFLIVNDVQKYDLIKNGNETILGMYVGTGFGNAIIINGELYYGKNGVAGELGHIPLYGVEDVCNCNNIGCAETRASGWYLAKLREKYFSETEFSDLFTYNGSNEILQKYVDDIAIVVSTEINILDPDYVIFAGGVISMNDFPKDCLIGSINKRLRKPYPLEGIKYIFSEHKQESGIIGGNIYARENLEVN